MADIKKIGCLGVGLMGEGIAQVSLLAGYDVVLIDIKDEFVDKAYNGIKGGMEKLAAKGNNKTIIETEVTATAVGRPRMGRMEEYGGNDA